MTAGRAPRGEAIRYRLAFWTGKAQPRFAGSFATYGQALNAAERLLVAAVNRGLEPHFEIDQGEA